MSSPDAPAVAVVLTPDKPGPYAPGDPLAVTVTAHKTATVKVSVAVTLPDGTTGSGDVDIPAHVPASEFTISSATDSAGDSFTQEPDPAGGAGVVLRTTLGTPTP